MSYHRLPNYGYYKDLVQVLETDRLRDFKTSYSKDVNKIYYGTSNTPLTLAILNEAKTITKFLLHQDVDVLKTSAGGITPLTAAVKVQNVEIVQRLMEKGAELTIHSAWPVALEVGNVDIVKCLLKHGAQLDKANLVEVVGRTHYDLLKYFHEIGANIKNFGTDGRTLLTKAIVVENFQIVKYLVEIMKVDVNLVDKNSNSPLSLAASQSEFRVVKYLIENGADLNEAKVALDKYAGWSVDFASYLESVKTKTTLVLNESTSTYSTDCGQEDAKE